MTDVRDAGQGTGPVGPQDRKLYQQEYKHGADLFQRALEEHAKSDNIYQKEEFKEVMDKAMRVLNETARELKEKNLLNQNEQIAKDYMAYQTAPNEQTKAQLEQDLTQAKRSVP